MAPRGGLAILLALVVVGGCASGTAAPAGPASPPPGWVEVASGAGDLALSLPPWLVPFETSGAVFANEVVDGGGQGIQILAEGPRTAEPQPEREGTRRWLEHRAVAPEAGVAAIEDVRLGSGRAVVLRRVDRAGTRLAWRLAAYAITTSNGTASVMIDGPPDAWIGREEDIARIADSVRTGPGRPGGDTGAGSEP